MSRVKGGFKWDTYSHSIHSVLCKGCILSCVKGGFNVLGKRYTLSCVKGEFQGCIVSCVKGGFKWDTYSHSQLLVEEFFFYFTVILKLKRKTL